MFNYLFSHRGGYYATMVKPDLKIISLNMNYCNNMNLWLLLNSTDPADELSWLIRELQLSELLKQKVHIIGHIPPGSNDCISVWSRNYHRIVNRYESTITAQFFGHTHQDEFLVFYDDEDVANTSKTFNDFRPTSVAYIGPSVTTFGGVNPGYRIYLMSDNYTDPMGYQDDDWKYRIVDHGTYYLNLTLANLMTINGTIDWIHSYSPLKEYKMNNLDPISWHKLLLKMANNDDMAHHFYRNFFVQSDYPPVQGCDKICISQLLCRMVTASSNDLTICERFLGTIKRIERTSKS